MTRSLAAAAAVQAVIAAVLGLVVLDMRAHNRVETLGGVNVWGYRGTELGRKQPYDVRIAAFGGDLAFGWGVRPTETLVSYVGRLVSLDLNRSGQPARPVFPIVAGARGMPVPDYAGWIDHFRDLMPDIICLIPDRADHPLGDGRFLPDRHSVVFERTGYSPILPLVLREKAIAMNSALVGLVAKLLEAADLETRHGSDAQIAPDAALVMAIQTARRVATIGVVLVLPPGWEEARFVPPPDDSRFRTVRLGADPRMRREDLRLDGYHFGAGGHSLAAEAVAPAVLGLIHDAERQLR